MSSLILKVRCFLKLLFKLLYQELCIRLREVKHRVLRTLLLLAFEVDSIVIYVKCYYVIMRFIYAELPSVVIDLAPQFA